MVNYIVVNVGGFIVFFIFDFDNLRGIDSFEFVDLKLEYWLLVGDNGNLMIIECVSK